MTSTRNASKTIQLHASDNVTIALFDLQAGTQIDERNTTLLNPVKRGHKIAMSDITKGTRITRYGQIIGEATRNIQKGEHIHTHNLGMSEHSINQTHTKTDFFLPAVGLKREFMGFHREDGRVGTRNYVGIITTVNCSGSVAKFVKAEIEAKGILNHYKNVDGIVAIAHGTGCGMSSSNEGYETLHRTLSGYIRHQNFGGILLIGLGCEVMQLSKLVGDRKIRSDGNLRFMTIQHEGGTRTTIKKAVNELTEILDIANKETRKPSPISELTIGMQCGGSDGYSGITANPALGAASDILVSHGGTSILSETPEIYGAEHLLTSRAVSPEVADKLTERIAWWEDYCDRNFGEMDNNPSPGNKRGGLTTILEKSLGAVAKSGTAPLREVYKYGEPITKKGFVFMDSPGFDPCSITGQIASGANVIVFTTGRGSVSGFVPSPGIKIATNTEMYLRMQEDMDLNCGDIISDGVTIEEKGRELFEMIIRIASGEETKSEQLGYGDTEFVPWQIGAVM